MRVPVLDIEPAVLAQNLDDVETLEVKFHPPEVCFPSMGYLSDALQDNPVAGVRRTHVATDLRHFHIHEFHGGGASAASSHTSWQVAKTELHGFPTVFHGIVVCHDREGLGGLTRSESQVVGHACPVCARGAIHPGGSDWNDDRHDGGIVEFNGY